MRIAGTGSINGIGGSFQSFYVLNVMQDSGSQKSIYAAGDVKTDGQLVANKLISTNGILELDDDGSHNGIINSPASLRINIDSDNGSTGESFIVGKNQTAINSNNELFRVQENGRVGIGTNDPGAGLDVNHTHTRHNKVNKYKWGGNTRSDYTLSFSVPNKDAIFHIRALWTHHASSHGCAWEGYIFVYTGHAGIQSTVNNWNLTSTNGGSWTVTRGGANSDIVIAKTAGTYYGNGEYSVEVTVGN
jgi:hypothetical protein